MCLNSKANNKPIFLSIENSSELFSISIGNGSVFSYKEIKSKTITSEYILYIINDLLKNNKLLLKNIDFCVIGIGPGNLTGVRLVSSVLQGLSLGKTLPIIEISSLSAIALEVFLKYKKNKIFIIIDAKFNNIYYNLYSLKNNYLYYLSNCNSYVLININEISFSYNNIFTIANVSKVITDKLNQFINIQNKTVFPKAIYLDILARNKIFNKEIKQLIKVGAFNSAENFYQKYIF